MWIFIRVTCDKKKNDKMTKGTKGQRYREARGQKGKSFDIIEGCVAFQGRSCFIITFYLNFNDFP